MTKWSLSQECKDGLAVEKCIQVIYHIFRLNEKMFFYRDGSSASE